MAQYLLLFLEGVITFISPCLLPLLPVYVSYFAAGGEDRRTALVNAIGFTIGFTLVFVAMGAFAGSVGRLLSEYTVEVNIAAGAVVMLFGLHVLGVIKGGFFSRIWRKSVDTERLGFFSSILFGFAFSIGWTPCVGAFLGSALMMASAAGSVWTGVLMLLVYALGLGLPFILSAVLIDRLKGAFAFIKKNYRVINALSGGLLILVGLLMATGLMGYYFSLLAI